MNEDVTFRKYLYKYLQWMIKIVFLKITYVMKF